MKRLIQSPGHVQCEIVKVWVAIGDLDHAWDIACAIQNQYERNLALDVLFEPLIAQNRIVQAFQGFDKSRLVSFEIDWWNHRISRGIHEFDRDEISSIFRAMHTVHVDLWIVFLARLTETFEKRRPGLSFDILQDLARLIGWMHPDWERIAGTLGVSNV